VINAIDEFFKNPRPGEVYNIGGGKENSASVLECIDRVEQLLNKKISWTYSDQGRQGDHICYYTDMKKFKSHYPSWNMTYSFEDILNEFARSF